MTTNVTPAVLCAATQITNAAATYITGAAASQTIIKRAVFNNITAGAVTITVYRVASGGSAGTTNEVISARPVSAGATDLAPELANMVLNAGDTIQAKASANTSVNMTASGFISS
tara:strand:- start:5031 stop:5375 length:345 start_codon:yes stop_codon:yes gene_type:complete